MANPALTIHLNNHVNSGWKVGKTNLSDEVIKKKEYLEQSINIVASQGQIFLGTGGGMEGVGGWGCNFFLLVLTEKT